MDILGVFNLFCLEAVCLHNFGKVFLSLQYCKVFVIKQGIFCILKSCQLIGQLVEDPNLSCYTKILKNGFARDRKKITFKRDFRLTSTVVWLSFHHRGHEMFSFKTIISILIFYINTVKPARKDNGLDWIALDWKKVLFQTGFRKSRH